MLPITTRLTTLLKIQSPIVSAPRYFATTPSMAAAVTGAGGLGFLGAGPDSSQKLRDGLRAVRAYLNVPSGVPVPVGVGLLGWVLDKTEVSDDPRIPTVLEEMPTAIWFAFGADLGRYVAQVRAYDAKREHKTVVFVIVNSTEEALCAANEWKVNVLVVQGNEAGGHGGAYAPPLLSLLQAVLREIPSGPVIIAAGGISTGAQSAALLAMGADGVVLGSRLLCTPESMYNDEMKNEILTAGLNATARSYAFDDVARTRFWPEGIDGRAISNHVLGKEKGEKDRIVVWAGVGIGLVTDKKDAAAIVKEVHDELVHTLQAVPGRIVIKL
ncbi:hypothetical protein FPV67DRAFT_1736980 [Lyophyllum atratum]|nr:hypothetical protein FPV67DRAFT_1736980 [Lyophyllum atratum]